MLASTHYSAVFTMKHFKHENFSNKSLFNVPVLLASITLFPLGTNVEVELASPSTCGELPCIEKGRSSSHGKLASLPQESRSPGFRGLAALHRKVQEPWPSRTGCPVFRRQEPWSIFLPLPVR